jgi:uncharacterized membrane protein YkvA (DUF1232 family)
VTDTEPKAKYLLPAVIARNERVVRERFWKKLLHQAARVPFAEDLGAAYFCVVDGATPMLVKALLLAALAYFVLPFDWIPALFLTVGLASDAAIAVATVRTVSKHIKPIHYTQARAALGIKEPA